MLERICVTSENKYFRFEILFIERRYKIFERNVAYGTSPDPVFSVTQIHSDKASMYRKHKKVVKFGTESQKPSQSGENLS